MKKLIALMLALTLLAIGTLAVIAKEVNSDRDTVTHIENAIYGDPTIAAGIQVKNQSHYANHLVWDQLYTVGSGTETEFDFHYGKYYANRKSEFSAFIISSGINYGFSVDVSSSEQIGIAKMYKELYDTLDYDEEASATVRLADYYDYYPIEVTVNLPTLFWRASIDNIQSDRYSFSGLSESDNEATYSKISEFFKIPVIEGEYVDIHVTKHRNGFGLGHGWSEKSTDEYFFNTASTYTDNTCFIAINNRTQKGEIMDFSHVPGGYGIYALPYGSALKADELAMVYALDESATVKYMTVSNDGERLLLLVYDNDSTFIEIIDVNTMTRLQRLKINDGLYSTVFPKDGFMAIEFRNEIAVIEEQEDGSYELKFVADKFDASYTDTDYFTLKTTSAMDFDGERLVIVDNLYFNKLSMYSEKCGFFVAVYGAEGLLYYGEYESSLDANLSVSANYTFNCQPLGDLEVTWGK